jgi:hypothetical protein
MELKHFKVKWLLNVVLFFYVSYWSGLKSTHLHLSPETFNIRMEDSEVRHHKENIQNNITVVLVIINSLYEVGSYTTVTWITGCYWAHLCPFSINCFVFL